MSWDLLLMVFLHVNYLCLMMRKNQINLSALNTADMLKYIKVIFQGPVVFLSRGRGGGGGRKILVMSRKCAVIFLFPSPPPYFQLIGSHFSTIPLFTLLAVRYFPSIPWENHEIPKILLRPPSPPAKARNNDCSLSNINTTYIMSIMYLSVSSLW